jgi:hypothetical protein
MAGSNLTSADKFNVYDRLAQLNRSFDFATDNLVELRQLGVLDKKQMETFCGFTKELQSQINHRMLETMRDLEGKDAFDFGKVRIERENYLNDERPAFGEIRKPMRTRKKK